MFRSIIIFIFCSILISCGSAKKTSRGSLETFNSTPSKIIETKSTTSTKADRIANFAKGYLGTTYKYGGTTERGMDCSGLIYMSFINGGDIFLPRTAREMAKEGKRIQQSKVQKGDLLFFKTNKSKRVINHAGLVIQNRSGEIIFIHASTSKGVMVSHLDGKYWSRAFAEARRIL